jgi:hypothetical protein
MEIGDGEKYYIMSHRRRRGSWDSSCRIKGCQIWRARSGERRNEALTYLDYGIDVKVVQAADKKGAIANNKNEKEVKEEGRAHGRGEASQEGQEEEANDEMRRWKTGASSVVMRCGGQMKRIEESWDERWIESRDERTQLWGSGESVLQLWDPLLG